LTIELLKKLKKQIEINDIFDSRQNPIKIKNLRSM